MQTRLIRPLKPFFSGGHTHAPGGPPIELEAHRAAELVKHGLAEYVAVSSSAPRPIGQAVNPAPAKAEQAVSPRQAGISRKDAK